MPFRFSGNSVFLTYSQCGITKDELLSSLNELIPCIRHYIIARELHTSGEYHLHAVISFTRQFNSRNERCFDVTINGSTFHPNIQRPRSLRQCKAYVTKGDDYITNSESFLGRTETTFADLVRTSTSKKDFLDTALSNNKTANRFTNAIAIANYLYGSAIREYVPAYSFDGNRVPLQLTAWAGGTIGKAIDRPVGLVLWSHGSGLGKTEWARSLGRHIYWNSQKDLSVWDEDAEYLVMDDMEWEFVPDKKPFFGAQKEFSTTDKYKGKVTLRWNKPLIFLCNYNVELLSDHKGNAVWNNWYSQRMIVVEIKNKLY